MSKPLPKSLIASFMLPLALLGACTQTSNTGELAAQPEEVESTITINEGKYKPINDKIKHMEASLRMLSEKSTYVGRYDEGLVYAIQGNDFHYVTELQAELTQTHTAILSFLADPDLNPNGRFTPGLVELSGSIGDTQKSMGNLYTTLGTWYAPADVMEDIRRLNNEAQAVRADMAGVANPKGTNASTPTILSTRPAP